MSHFVFITLLAAFPALSTDMYLPALPVIQAEMGVTHAVANLSLVLFFVFFSGFLLVFGPLADRFGRRPVLLGGIGVYVVGSVLCAVSQGITLLVAARVVQAAGAASGAALSMVLAKDLYSGEERQKILAYIGVIVPLCPMIAPSIGQFVLHYASWHWIFALQAVMAFVAFYGSVIFKEPEFERAQGGVRKVVALYGETLRNMQFTVYAFAFAFMGVGFFGYLASSPEIYINHFGQSGQTYALLFGLNACGFMTGSLTCSLLGKRFSPAGMLRVSLAGILAGSICVLLWGHSVYGFAGTVLLMTFSLGVSRPISNNMILETVDKNVGTAASILTFTYFILGAVAMEIASLDWESNIWIVGSLGLLAGGIPSIALLAMRSGRRSE